MKSSRPTLVDFRKSNYKTKEKGADNPGMLQIQRNQFSTIKEPKAKTPATYRNVRHSRPRASFYNNNMYHVKPRIASDKFVD